MSKSKKKRYKSIEPYPNVIIAKPNIDYAFILLDDYASANSELTAINEYIYASVLSISESQLAEDFMQIGMVEMKHLDMLADLILQLGVAPKYVDHYGNFWNASVVPYGISSEDRLRRALQGEIAAINQYKKHIALINNPQIVCLLKRIIMDEELHMKILKADLLKYFC